jgi:hypothetical protein
MKCDKCQGKVFVDLTFTDNKNYETFCLRCGKRVFIGPGDPWFATIRAYVKAALVA